LKNVWLDCRKHAEIEVTAEAERQRALNGLGELDAPEAKRLYVVYPGSQRYALGKNIDVLPLAGLLAEIEALRKRRGNTTSGAPRTHSR